MHLTCISFTDQYSAVLDCWHFLGSMLSPTCPPYKFKQHSPSHLSARVQEFECDSYGPSSSFPQFFCRHRRVATFRLAQSSPCTSPSALWIQCLPFLASLSLLCALPSLPPHGTWCGWIWDSCFCPSASGQGTVDAVGFRPWESTIWAQSKYPKTSHTVKSNNWGVSSMPYYARECYPAPQTWRTLRGKLKAGDLSIFAFYLCDKIQVLKTPGVQRRKHDKRLAGSEKQGMSQRKQNLHWLLARGPG